MSAERFLLFIFCICGGFLFHFFTVFVSNIFQEWSVDACGNNQEGSIRREARTSGGTVRVNKKLARLKTGVNNNNKLFVK